MAKSLLHATERLRRLARVAGVYVDTYMALSVLEFGFGSLLQRLPRLLPVVQTTVSAFANSWISFLPPCSSVVKIFGHPRRCGFSTGYNIG